MRMRTSRDRDLRQAGPAIGIRFCRQALEALCADRIDILAGSSDPQAM